MSLLVKLINLLVDGGLDLVLMMDPLKGINIFIEKTFAKVLDSIRLQLITIKMPMLDAVYLKPLLILFYEYLF